MIHPAVHAAPVPDPVMQILNAGISFVLVAIIVILLVRHGAVYNLAERLGHGLAGAAVFLSAFKQLGLAELIAPFNDWYQLLWRVGWVLLLGGKLWRMERHRRANAAAVAEARSYLSARGILINEGEDA